MVRNSLGCHRESRDKETYRCAVSQKTRTFRRLASTLAQALEGSQETQRGTRSDTLKKLRLALALGNKYSPSFSFSKLVHLLIDIAILSLDKAKSNQRDDRNQQRDSFDANIA
jgi:hypothetical protein